MFKMLRARLIQGHRTNAFPETPPALPERFLGRPTIASDATDEDAVAASAHCHVGAILTVDGQLAIDTGKCIFCGRCAEACPKITFTREHRLASTSRSALIVTPRSPAIPEDIPNPEARACCSRSLKIRQVSAGGCAACELDFNVLGTPAWDFSRFGLQIAASPRHADAILVTGPITDNMKLALLKTHAAMAKPAWVIACGTCAISGGIYSESLTASGGLEDVLRPDLYIPGCPQHPATLLDALLRFMGRMKDESAKPYSCAM